MKTYTDFFFDFDGTIMDTSEGIFNAFDYALSYFGKELPGHDFYDRCIGPPLAYSFENFFGFSKEMACGECIKKYREYYTPKGLYEVKIYPGIEQVLKILHDDGCGVYLATSKPEYLALTLLKKYNLLQYFTFCGGADESETRADKVQVIDYVIESCSLQGKKDKILMIGDRKYDILGAGKRGIDAIGVLWGFGSREEFTDCNAYGIIESPEEILLFKE